MPVASVVGQIERHDDEVSGADRDLLLASGTQVLLAGLERMNERDFEVFVALVVYPRNAHNSSRMTTTKAEATRTMSDLRFLC